MAKYLTFYLMPLTSNRFNLRKTLQNSDCLSDATVPQGKVLASLIWYLLSFIQVCLEDTFDHMHVARFIPKTCSPNLDRTCSSSLFLVSHTNLILFDCLLPPNLQVLTKKSVCILKNQSWLYFFALQHQPLRNLFSSSLPQYKMVFMR